MVHPMVYGGDEVSAVVMDVGSSTVKAGYSGEDVPRKVFASKIGSLENEKLTGEAVHHWRRGMEVSSVVNQGVVVDWDGYESLWETCFIELGLQSEQVPLILSDPEWNSKESREKILELGFEKFKLPGIFLARSSVLSAFSVGKSTALIIDVGSSKTSVVPVHDGYVLKKGVQFQAVGGDFVSEQIIRHFEKSKIPIVPQYLVSSKGPVESALPPVFKEYPNRRSQTLDSFHDLQILKTVDDFKETVCAVSEGPFNPNHLIKKATKNYEFPNGYNNAFRIERFRLVEGLFDPRYIIRSSEEDPATASSHAPMIHLIRSALNNVDIDLRSLLLSNIVLMGGTTLMPGFGDRIYNELYSGIPGAKIKVHAPGSSIERKFGAWIGGSILSSLGTFHQLWISKQQYEEMGTAVEKKLH